MRGEVSPAEVEPLLAELPAEGLMLSVWCSTQQEAEELLKKALQRTRSRSLPA